jgi:adenylate cyclase
MDHGGVVDKYIGDAIMVVFGVPQSGPDDASRALHCAVAMAEAMRSWSDLREQRGLSSVRIGVGGHYGSAFAGVLSDGRLLEYTVIGDTVNVASRLADLPGRLSTNVAVSADLLAAAAGLPAPDCWSSAVVESLPGRPRPIAVHRWMGS